MLNGAYKIKYTKEEILCDECESKIPKDSRYLFVVTIETKGNSVNLSSHSLCKICGTVKIAGDVEERNAIYNSIKSVTVSDNKMINQKNKLDNAVVIAIDEMNEELKNRRNNR